MSGDILTNIFKELDNKHVPIRRNGVQPFVLVDAHQSRFALTVLNYINNPAHPWTVCIGVPYGTHLWQVADAEQINGVFTQEFSKEKALMLKQLTESFSDAKLTRIHIVPIFNLAWRRSFGNLERNKKAIRERGWRWCNRILLDSKTISSTMCEADKKLENMKVWGKYYGKAVAGSTECNMAAAGTSVPSDTNRLVPEDLNFSRGKGSEFVMALYQKKFELEFKAQIKEKKRKNNAQDVAHKRAKESFFANLTTGGKCFVHNNLCLNNRVLDSVRTGVNAKKYKDIASKIKKFDEYSMAEEGYKKVILKNKPVEEWNVADLKAVVRYRRNATESISGKFAKKDALRKTLETIGGRPLPVQPDKPTADDVQWFTEADARFKAQVERERLLIEEADAERNKLGDLGNFSVEMYVHNIIIFQFVLFICDSLPF